jgi:hypothetical protein
MADCKVDVSATGIVRQALASSSPVLATLLLLGWSIINNQHDVRDKLNEAEAQLQRVERRLHALQADLDRVERRTRGLDGR